MAAPSMAAVILMLLLIAFYSYFRQVIVLFSRLSFWARVPVFAGYTVVNVLRRITLVYRVLFIYVNMTVSDVIISLRYAHGPLDQAVRRHVLCLGCSRPKCRPRGCRAGRHVAYKYVIPFTNIMLPSHARSPWNRKRYQRSSVSVPLMYDAAYHRHAAHYQLSCLFSHKGRFMQCEISSQ